MENTCGVAEARSNFERTARKLVAGGASYQEFHDMLDMLGVYAQQLHGPFVESSNEEADEEAVRLEDLINSWEDDLVSLEHKVREKFPDFLENHAAYIQGSHAVNVLKWLIRKGVISEKDIDLNRIDAGSMLEACGRRPDGESLPEFLKGFIMSRWLKVPQRFFRRFRKCPPLPDDILDFDDERIVRKFEVFEEKFYTDFVKALNEKAPDADLICAYAEWHVAYLTKKMVKETFRIYDKVGETPFLDPEKADPAKVMRMRLCY